MVTRTGAIQSGDFHCKAEGSDPKSGTDFCYDSLDDADYESGRIELNVEVEVDVDALFKAHDVQGVITSAVFTGEGLNVT